MPSKKLQLPTLLDPFLISVELHFHLSSYYLRNSKQPDFQFSLLYYKSNESRVFKNVNHQSSKFPCVFFNTLNQITLLNNFFTLPNENFKEFWRSIHENYVYQVVKSSKNLLRNWRSKLIFFLKKKKLRSSQFKST